MCKYIYAIIAMVLFFCACSLSDSSQSSSDSAFNTLSKLSFVNDIEHAHKKENFRKHELISFDLNLAFGGRERFNGQVMMSPDGQFVRLNYRNGIEVWYDGQTVYQLPKERMSTGKFDLFTWTYFFALPYKLNDQGTVWEKKDPISFDDQICNAQRLSFSENTGESPDDWYLIASNQESNLIEAAVYINTYGKTKAAAEKAPTVISYENYQIINDIPFATEWKFWEWTSDQKLGKLLGTAKLSNFQFQSFQANWFAPSSVAKKL